MLLHSKVSRRLFRSLVGFIIVMGLLIRIGEDMTDHQILELTFGAGNKNLEQLETVTNESSKKDKEVQPHDVVVTHDQFIKILSRDLNQDKKKLG